jgi:7-carboxy-7-deazaguanine synthase
MHAVDPEKVRQLPRMNNDAIMSRLLELSGYAEWVILSGGNPSMLDLSDLIDRLHEKGFKVAIEMQGDKAPWWLAKLDHITISPKGPSALLPDNQYLAQTANVTKCLRAASDVRSDPALALFAKRNCDLKVPIFTPEDYQFARNMHASFPEYQMYLTVGNNLGEDDTAALLNKLKWLVETTVEDSMMKDVQVIPQLHVLIWGNDIGH